MKICIVGSGYVGLVTAACLADIGHHVTAVDNDAKKIALLKDCKIPIYEPGLEDIVQRHIKTGNLSFTTQLSEGMKDAQAAFIAVGTPPGEDGSADLSAVLAVAKEIGALIQNYTVVVNKSTVPVGTAKKVTQVIQEQLKARKLENLQFSVVSNPEFLKEGDAINDFMRPDRIVIGANDERAADILKEVYAPFVRNGHPIIVMDVASSELTKYAANCMLATRVSFINELSHLAKKVGADIDQIRKGIGTDRRIGMPFLYAGLGYGGSCFPKDIEALVRTMAEYDVSSDMLQAVRRVNESQRQSFLEMIFTKFGRDLKNKTFAVWGLSFKPKTDDMRKAPSVDVINSLVSAGAKVNTYDPVAMDAAKSYLPKEVKYFENMYDGLKGADAILLLTEWNVFRNPDFSQMESLMKSKIMFDGRNQFEPKKMKELGWEYECFGRSDSCNY